MGALFSGPSPFRWMSKVETKLSDPAKKWFGLSGEKSREWGAMYRSVVRETRGYEAIIEGVKGERSRIGRERRETRRSVDEGV